MKTANLTLLLLLVIFIAKAQKPQSRFEREQVATALKTNDFSLLFTHTDNSEVFGFIGSNYQRIQIKFLTVNKSAKPYIYIVTGKSMVKNTVDAFKGTIVITNVHLLSTIFSGVDSEYKNKGIKTEGRLVGTYTFAEDSTLVHSGKFTGTFETGFYIDKNNKIHYDDIEIAADGYFNNQFTGVWKSYTTNVVKKCNWGDYRISDSGDLDIGAGDFSPNDKYLKYGWQSVRDFLDGSGIVHEKAKQIENAQWWK